MINTFLGGGNAKKKKKKYVSDLDKQTGQNKFGCWFPSRNKTTGRNSTGV
jgi:hypothetical protein